MNDLDDIALKMGTDKSTRRHGYTIHYEKYFANLRSKKIALLELGVSQGRSLKMWEAYFPKAAVYGLDVNEFSRECESERIKVFVGSARKVSVLNKVMDTIGGNLDIVIDDDGHRCGQQRTSLDFLWPFLNPGGIYAIEDLETSYQNNMGGGYRSPGNTIEYLKSLVESLNSDFHDIESNPVFDGSLEAVHFYRGLCLLVKKE